MLVYRKGVLKAATAVSSTILGAKKLLGNYLKGGVYARNGDLGAFVFFVAIILPNCSMGNFFNKKEYYYGIVQRIGSC